MTKKQIFAKVYDAQGNFIKVWTDFRFESFVKELFSGVGECILTLGREFDYSGKDLQLGNNVELWVSDKDTFETIEGAVPIYKGYVSLIVPIVDGREEKIEVNLLGHYTKLALDILKNGQTTTLYTDNTNGLTTTSPGSSADVGLIMRAIIDRYRTEANDTQIYYDSKSIQSVGQNLYYVFEQKTYKEAMDIVLSATPANYYYYVNELGKVFFKQKSDTPTHRFIFGRHFKSVKIERSIEKVRNFILVWDGQSGGIYKAYSDEASIKKYGRRVHRIVSSGIQDTTSADNIGNKFLNENKDPSIKVISEILDNNLSENRGYDIESISPGDTCSFYGFDPGLAELFTDNMLITRVEYRLDRAIIEVEIQKSGLFGWQENTQKEINDILTSGTPSSYTT